MIWDTVLKISSQYLLLWGTCAVIVKSSLCFSEKISLVQTILRAILEKRPKKSKGTFFGHLIPYDPGLSNLSEKPSGSNDRPYYPLHSYKNLGRSLMPFWRKGQKSSNRRTEWQKKWWRNDGRKEKQTDRWTKVNL